MNRHAITVIGVLTTAFTTGCNSPVATYQQNIQSYMDQENQKKSETNKEHERTLNSIRSSKLPKNHKQLIDKQFTEILKDPTSRKVEFTSTPYGSLVCGLINAKNSYGGYTGKTPFTAYFDDKGNLQHLGVYSESDFKHVRSFSGYGEYKYVEYQLLKDCKAA